MVNELINTMATDMKIPRYKNETDISFTFRVVYSGLGYWCLKITSAQNENHKGESKNFVTRKLNNNIARFCELIPELRQSFVDLKGESAAKKISVLYEEMGYIIERDGKIALANFGRGIEFGLHKLYFGLPESFSFFSGLGIYTDLASYLDEIENVLIRDKLTPEQYVKSCFGKSMFAEWNMDGEFEYFNPLKINKSISWSWEDAPTTKYTVARTKTSGTAYYFRVITLENGVKLFKPEVQLASREKLVDREYRRLYYALKAYYSGPFTSKYYKLDDTYGRLEIFGGLPNRELFFLLLVAWPDLPAYENKKFIIRNELLSKITTVLNNIGIKVELRNG